MGGERRAVKQADGHKILQSGKTEIGNKTEIVRKKLTEIVRKTEIGKLWDREKQEFADGNKTSRGGN